MSTPDLHTAARAAVAALATDPGIPTRLTTNPDRMVMWHIDHEFLDAVAFADRPKTVWSAMTALTAHGIAWTNPDIDAAHRILAVGGVLVLAFDTEDESDV